MGHLDGRVAVVTGAGRGIGAGVATMLASCGASVVVNDLGVTLDGNDPDPATSGDVVRQIVERGGRAVSSGADISSFESAEELIQMAVDTYGGLDIVVNVAGILRDRMIFNMTEEDWDSVIRVHLKGTFNTSRHASVYWRKHRDEGKQFRLINFTSGSGLHGAPGQPNYSAAKMGVVGLTYSCANALATYGVTSNAIAPLAATRMTESVPEGRRRASSDPERSVANVASVVAYLASDDSSWCNGQVISVRGDDIGLYNRPQIIRQITLMDQLEYDPFFAIAENVFGGAIVPDTRYSGSTSSN